MSSRPIQRDHFCDEQGSRLSAELIVPLVMELIQPRTVVDLGCGFGTWLSVFREQGVEEILGIDGEYVDRSLLEIPAERFQPYDLTQPLQLDRTFDLAISLEVGEHLPAACADDFVASLARLAPVVLFSAAIPLQGGVNHVNEQWPEYWVERFRQQGYLAIDAIRPRVWQSEQAEWWYLQNTLVFARPGQLSRNPALEQALASTHQSALARVHPRLYTRYARRALPRPLEQLLLELPGAARESVRRLIRR